MRQKLTAFLLCLLFVFSSTLFLLPHHASAETPTATEKQIRDAKFKWVNRAQVIATISTSSGPAKLYFFDQDIGDSNFTYKAKKVSYGGETTEYKCFGEIYFSDAGWNNSTQRANIDINSAIADIDRYDPGNTSHPCINVGDTGSNFDIKVDNPNGAANIIYELSEDAQTINRVDHKRGAWIFQQVNTTDQKQLFLRKADDDSCKDSMYLPEANFANLDFPTARLYILENDDEKPALPKELHAAGCHSVTDDVSDNGWAMVPSSTASKNNNFKIAGAKSEAKTDTGAVGVGDTELGNTSGDDNATCEASGNPLTWVLCPVFNGIADFCDWLFNNLIQPFLYTAPINTDSNDPSYQIWSSFRIYGNIFLIIALFVIVFGQAIGGGLIDAYTAKKVLPRLLVAAVLINISVYLVNFMVDITNILGNGLGELILAPLKASGQLSFTPDAGQSISVVFWTGFLGVFAGGTAIAGVLGGLAFGAGAFIAKAAIFILLAVIVPTALALIGVFVTLVLRRGLILLLLLVSPVAFALYCLPNTEKYFRKWWDLLFKALMVYPLVIVIFAIADVLSVAVLNAGGIKADGALQENLVSAPLAAITAFVLQFLPLFLIPFAFKFAGGAIGAIQNAVTGGAGKVNGMLKTRREQAKQDVQGRMLEGRGDIYNRLQKGVSTTKTGVAGAATRGLSRFMKGRVGGYDIEGALSAYRAAKGKELGDVIVSGDDSEIRATAMDADLIKTSKGGIEALRRSGFTEGENGDFKIKDGRVQLKNISGKWYDSSESIAGLERYGGDRAALQKIYSYEIQKALTQQDNDGVAEGAEALQRSWNMTDEQMSGIMIGAGFEQQNKSKQWKRYSTKGGKLHLDAKGLADEVHGQIGTYQGIAQDADTWTTMAKAYLEAMPKAINGDASAQEAMSKLGDVAKQFEGMTPQQIAQQVQQAQAATGQDATPGASAAVAATLQEFITTVNSGRQVANGTVAKRRRNEVIDF